MPPIPIGQGQARGIGFALSAIGSLVWGAKKRQIKKQRDGQGIGLRGGRGSILITNNQPIVGGSGRGDVWVEACGWESVWGDTIPSFGVTIQTMEKYIYEINRCLWMAPDQQQRLTQQPTKNRRPQQREVWRGGAMSGRRMGNVIPLFGQKNEQQRKRRKRNTPWP